MSHEPLRHDDVDGLLAAARALPAPRPTAAQKDRQRRALDDAIAADAVARRRLSPIGVAAVVVLVASGAAAAFVGVVVGTREAPPPIVAAVTPPRPTAVVPIVVPPPTAISATAPTPTKPAPTPTKKPATLAAPVASIGDADDNADVDAALAMLIGGDARTAAADLGRALRADFAGVDARLAKALERSDLDDDAAGRVRRLRCESGLRHRRDVAAVEVCRAYSQHHPDDVAARPLAFGAGGLAEDLGRLDDAIDLYTRCIVMAPLHGQSSADALKARARVHAAAGHTDDAAADLRLFLRLRPGAGFDDDVRALARELGVR